MPTSRAAWAPLAKTLSMDMRANDPAGSSSSSTRWPTPSAEERAFDMPFPPHGEQKLIPGVVSAFAQVVRYRCEQLGALTGDLPDPGARRPVQREEPKTGTDGTLSWTVDIYNPATGEDFVLGLKEITPAAERRHPPVLDVAVAATTRAPSTACRRMLSLDMRVMDPAWIGMKLRKLLDYPEPLGDFMAFVPGTRRQQNWPSTVAYLAALIIHRYAMLGILDEKGYPTREMGILEAPR